MTDLPEPLTPADCDLRTYEWMPLDVNRLLTSETWILGTADEKVAAVTLWCEAWRQVPAASLPDDDRMLAHLSRTGAGWKKVREAVMRSWIKCSDGRLYHPVVAEKALVSYNLKNQQRERTEAARLAKEAARKAKEAERLAKLSGGGGSTPQSLPTEPVTEAVTEAVTDAATEAVTISVTETVTEPVTASIRTEQNRTEQERKKERDASAEAPASTRRGARLSPDWQPSPDDRAFCLGLGLNVQDVAAGFRDYWHAKPGKDGAKLDWSATWRNWCRREKPPSVKPAFRNGFAELMAEDFIEHPTQTDDLGDFLRVEHVRN
jgi:hypothetical protein